MILNNPFSFFDRIFYINLESRKDRKYSIENEFLKYNINASRWPAIRISEEENDRLTAKGYPLCEPVSDDDLYHKEKIINVTLGQRSCLFSHLSIIEYAKVNNLNNILIFEDDVIFNDEVDVIEVLSKAVNELKNIEWDMFKLGCIFTGLASNAGENLYKLSTFSAAHAYAVNKSCYDIILNFPFKEEMNIDVRYGMLSGSDIIKAYTPKIPLAFQREDFSNIQMHDVGSLKPYILDRYSNMIM
jgi:glycosyl transferase family 25